MTKHALDVSGMMCEGCAGSVESALSGVSGVREVEVSLDDDRAEVVTDEGVDAGALVDAVQKAGYEASPAM